jgi:alkanesulfonate monooxygenase SsuD/methylene tetrahydromethanopterin reductase-like flavin-dependent oxidoreductase (luciferase family)
MQIGISLHNNWGIEDVQAIVQLASRAEALGFASVWVHDHNLWTQRRVTAAGIDLRF